MKPAIVLALAAALCAVPAAGAAGEALQKPFSAPAAVSSPSRYVPGQVLVGFRSTAPREARARAVDRAGAQAARRLGTFDMQLVKLPRGLTVGEAVRRLNRDPAVAWAEPNYLRYPLANPPTDALFGDEWDLNNTGQLHAVSDADGDNAAEDHAGSADADIDAPEAWGVAEGDNAVVGAVIDTGFDVTHPDLTSQMWTNPVDSTANSTDEDNNGKTDDVHGWNFGGAVAPGNNVLLDPPPHFEGFDHGTHVAGTIAAAHDDATGVVGVCPACRIMGLKVAREDGSIPISTEVAALAYAKSEGVKIANMSLGGLDWSNAEREAIRQSGMLVVVSAGNDSLDNDMALSADGGARSSPSLPAAYTLPNILTVAASNDEDRYAYFTECFADFGFTRQECAFTDWGHDSVDVAAPGADITSTVPGGGYETWDGTSMAAPHVAGIAGLVLSQNPLYSVAQLKNAIMHGVDKPLTLKKMPIAPPFGGNKSGAFTRTSGRVNAFSALTASTTNATPVSDGNIDHARLWSTLRQSGSVAWPADINDVYKRRLSRGHTYRITLVVPAGRDYDLLVWKPGTKEIWQQIWQTGSRIRAFSAHGGARDEVVQFKVRATGIYYVQITAWLFKSGGYTLKFKRIS
jgi:subtilisin family serine protease